MYWIYYMRQVCLDVVQLLVLLSKIIRYVHNMEILLINEDIKDLWGG
jgi:hypothetical protein